MQCGAAPATGTTEGSGHAGEESTVEMGPPAYPCLRYAPKCSNSGSEGWVGGKATQGAW